MVAVEEKEDEARQEAIEQALETFWLGQLADGRGMRAGVICLICLICPRDTNNTIGA